MYGVQRLTFGSNQLLSGIEMIPVLIGIFAITEVLQQTISDDRLTADDAEKQVLLQLRRLCLL